VNRPATAADFEAMYQRDLDPWGYRHSWYEQRKYAISVATLTRRRYRLVWEPACSIGVLSWQLAERADRVLASDGSPTAINAARRSVQPIITPDAPTPGRIDWSVQVLPGPAPAPAGTADLVVLSEILYYLAEPDRRAVLATAHELLEPGGDLLVVHWRPMPDDAHLSGDDANAWVRSQSGWSTLVNHVDENFVLDLLRRP
jgi:chemotaxis methyl-accepting protein methylase